MILAMPSYSNQRSTDHVHKSLPSFGINAFVLGGSLDESISNIKGVWCIYFNYISHRNLYANSESPDYTPRSYASDMGLHCFAKGI